jgi:hypothetical protein
MVRIFPLVAAAVLLAGCSTSRQGAASTASQPPAIRVAGTSNTIPAKTEIDVLTNEEITNSSSEGRTYTAQIATDIRSEDGRMLIPKGSPAELVLMETREKSGVKGPSMQVGMRSVTVEGTSYMVVSQEVSRSTGLGANRRTAEMVGGGAALGTIIGATAGGARGGAIGALAGAAAGAAVQVLTQGKDVRIPAETVLKFRLEEPIQLQAATP